jgi:hypothetical protein
VPVHVAFDLTRSHMGPGCLWSPSKSGSAKPRRLPLAVCGRLQQMLRIAERFRNMRKEFV